jgi:hypothetical protein
VTGSRWSGVSVPESLLFAASLAAVAVYVAVGAGRPVWLDEANTISICSRSFSGIVEALQRANNFPLYFFLLSIWIRLFGDSEIALRVLSAIFYLAGGAAAFALGRRISSTSRGAWYSAFFYLSSPLAVLQAQNIRMYSLLGLLSALSTLFFIRLLFDDHQSQKTRALLVLVNAAGILTHVWFVFVLAAQLLAVMVFERERLRAYLAGMAIAGLPFLALWLRPFSNQLQNGATNWMAVYPVRLLVLAPLEFYGVYMALPYYFMAAYAWTSAEGNKRAPLLQERKIPLLFLVFAASMAFPLLVCFVRPIYYPGRYAIIALPPLAALLATVFSNLFPRVLLPLLCFPLLGLGVVSQVAHRNDVVNAETPIGQSDRATAQFLLEHAAPGDALVFTSLTRPAADYYLRRAGALGRFVEVNFPKENETHPSWEDAEAADRRSALEAEATATATRLAQIAASGRKVWFYDNRVGDRLKRHLNSSLPEPRVHLFSGPYHDRILEYRGAGF